MLLLNHSKEAGNGNVGTWMRIVGRETGMEAGTGAHRDVGSW